jgi:hypothetical protein
MVGQLAIGASRRQAAHGATGGWLLMEVLLATLLAGGAMLALAAVVNAVDRDPWVGWQATAADNRLAVAICWLHSPAGAEARTRLRSGQSVTWPESGGLVDSAGRVGEWRVTLRPAGSFPVVTGSNLPPVLCIAVELEGVAAAQHLSWIRGTDESW